jgi:membrane protein implicated in regulation of membrane protease activity
MVAVIIALLIVGAALVAGIAVAVLEPVGSVVLVLLLGGPFAAAGVALIVVSVRKAYLATHRPVSCGAEGLVGHVGVVSRSLDPVGHVAIDGELWRARRSWAEEDEPPPREGDAVVVDHVHGLTLSVRRAEIWEVER